MDEALRRFAKCAFSCYPKEGGLHCSAGDAITLAGPGTVQTGRRKAWNTGRGCLAGQAIPMPGFDVGCGL